MKWPTLPAILLLLLPLLHPNVLAEDSVNEAETYTVVDGITLKIIGKQLRNGTIVILIKNTQLIDIYGFAIGPDSAIIQKARAPPGWHELPGDVTSFFMTDNNPIKFGKLSIFRLKIISVHSPISFHWVASGKDGTQLDGGSLEIKNKYSNLESKSSARCKGSATCFTGFVTHIVDGDTIDVNTVRIRLALVNTPERGDRGYAEATKFTATLCPVGSTVLVDEDDGQTQGSYDRMIGKVFCGNKVLNEELLKAGLAVMYTNFCAVSEFSSEGWAQRYGC